MAKSRTQAFKKLSFDMGVLMNRALQSSKDELEEYVREKIDELVYQVETPNSYERTGKLKESARIDIHPNRDFSKIEIDIYHEVTNAAMPVNKDKYQHGSNYQDEEDIRPFLSDIIEEGAGPLFGDGWWREGRPYKEEIKRALIEEGKLQEILTRKISW